MHARAALVVLATTATLTACSGGDDDASPITDVDQTSPPSVSSADAPSTSVLAAATSTSTSTTTSTTSTSTSAPTTPAPPDTTAPASTSPSPTLVTPEQIAEAQALDRQMAIDVESSWRTYVTLFRRAQMYPTDQEALEALVGAVAPEWAERMTALITRLANANRRLLEEPLAEPTLTVERLPYPVVDTSDEVTIVVCEIDPWVLVEVGAAPDGTDLVVNNTIYANRVEVRLRLIDDMWKVVQEVRLQQWEGSTTCAG